MSDTITQESLPGTETNVDASSGTGAGESTEEVVTVKDLMKTVLNKEFPTDEAALKSLKDTYSYVGQMGQKVQTLEQQLQDAANAAPKVSDETAKQLAELSAIVKNQTFFNEHPEFNTPEIKALITDMGGDPTTVVEKESFKRAAAALKDSAQNEQNKSVLHSNPRLGIAQDSMAKAQEAKVAGKQAEAEALGLKAVMEAFPELKS